MKKKQRSAVSGQRSASEKERGPVAFEKDAIVRYSAFLGLVASKKAKGSFTADFSRAKVIEHRWVLQAGKTDSWAYYCDDRLTLEGGTADVFPKKGLSGDLSGRLDLAGHFGLAGEKLFLTRSAAGSHLAAWLREKAKLRKRQLDEIQACLRGLP